MRGQYLCVGHRINIPELTRDQSLLKKCTSLRTFIAQHFPRRSRPSGGGRREVTLSFCRRHSASTLLPRHNSRLIGAGLAEQILVELNPNSKEQALLGTTSPRS